MKFSDIQECSKCGGNGLKSQKNKLTSLIEIVPCPHCHGTGQEPFRVDKFLPRYRIGEELTLVCDSCGGDGSCTDQDPEFGGHQIQCPTCKGTPNKTILITEVEYNLIGSEHGVNV